MISIFFPVALEVKYELNRLRFIISDACASENMLKLHFTPKTKVWVEGGLRNYILH